MLTTILIVLAIIVLLGLATGRVSGQGAVIALLVLVAAWVLLTR